MVNKRDDFTQKVKKILAERVNFKCSNPECRAQTSGPQLDSTKSLNVGVASHITAAADRGPRFNQRLTSEQRKDISNGIWLCQTCAKLIDNDRKKYTSEILQAWKLLAEQAAMDSIGKTSVAAENQIIDKWVNMQYVEKSGLSDKLKEQGYMIRWESDKKEIERIDLEKWEYVLVPQPEGSRTCLKVKNPSLGGYLVLIKKKMNKN